MGSFSTIITACTRPGILETRYLISAHITASHSSATAAFINYNVFGRGVCQLMRFFIIDQIFLIRFKSNNEAGHTRKRIRLCLNQVIVVFAL